MLTILINAWITAPFQKVSKYWRQYQFIKKIKQLTKTFIDWKVCYLIFPNLMKHIYMMSWMHTFTIFCQNFNAAYASLSCSGFSFYEHFSRQFIFVVWYIHNRKICFSKKILYQYFVSFLPWLGHLLLGKHFTCHYIALKT